MRRPCGRHGRGGVRGFGGSRSGAIATAVAALLLAGCAGGHDEGATEARDPNVIRIGLLSTLDGPLKQLGEAANRGAKLALLEVGGTLVGTGPLDTVRGARIAGKAVQLYVEGSDDASPDIAVSAARRLVEQRGVDVIIGPTSGDEGLAVKNYIAGVPGVTLVNGTAAAQNMTLRDPAPNVFRFSTDGTQWMAGLGTYAAEKHKRIATVAGDDTFRYDQVGGFLTEFCGRGHSVAQRLWIPAGTSDFAAYVSQVPKDVDAVFVALDSDDAVTFVHQLDRFTKRPDLPIIGGSLTIDAAAITQLGDRLEHAVWAGPVAPLDTPAYESYVAALAENYPGAGAPGLADVLYYVAMKATITALQQAGGDAGGDQRTLRQALRQVQLDTPQGPVRLDGNQQVIANNYLFEVRDGQSTLLRTVPDVDQTLNRDRAAYITRAAFDRSNPACGQPTPGNSSR